MRDLIVRIEVKVTGERSVIWLGGFLNAIAQLPGVKAVSALAIKLAPPEKRTEPTPAEAAGFWGG